jgi:hypothetical protein
MKSGFSQVARHRVVGRRAGRAVTAATIGLALLLSACDGSTINPTPTPTTTTSFSSAGTRIDTVCGVLDTRAAGDVANRLLHVEDANFKGALLEDLVIEAVQKGCRPLLGAAVTAVQGFFDQQPNNLVAPVITFQSKLPQLTPSQVEDVVDDFRNLDISVSSIAITSLVSRICTDLEGSPGTSDPVTDFRNAVGNGASLSALSAVNQIISLVLQRCGGQINNFQADGLLQSLIGYLVANERLEQSITPPIIQGLTWEWSALTDVIRITWEAVNPSDKEAYQLLDTTDNGSTWVPVVTMNTTQAFVPVRAVPNEYQFALRAVDTRGRISGWLYLRPCLAGGCA